MSIVLLNMVITTIVICVIIALTMIAIALIVVSIVRSSIAKKKGKRTKKVGLWVGVSMLAAPWVVIGTLFLISVIGDKYYNTWNLNREEITKAVMAESPDALYEMMADDVVSRNDISKDDLKTFMDKLDIERLSGEDLEKYYKAVNAGKDFHYRSYSSHENGRTQNCFQYTLYNVDGKDGRLYLSGVRGDAKGKEFVGIYYIMFKEGDDYLEFGEQPPKEVYEGKTVSGVEDYGSFTMEKSRSYDGEYFAKCFDSDKGNKKIKIFSMTGEEVAKFIPCRARDFWGYCWANDSYDIWIQSGDIGVVCYSKDGDEWVLNEDAVKPDYIISRYDK